MKDKIDHSADVDLNSPLPSTLATKLGDKQTFKSAFSNSGVKDKLVDSYRSPENATKSRQKYDSDAKMDTPSTMDI